MPIYNVQVPVPAKTLATAPLVTSIYPSDRWVEHIEINFPLRCALQVGVQLRAQGSQFAPAAGGGLDPASQFVRADSYVVAWDEEYDLGPPPHKVDIYAYNLDVYYPHTVDVRLVIVPDTFRGLLRRAVGGGGT